MDYIYKILKKNYYTFKNYSLVPIRMEDKLLIKQWRNEQMSILRQNKILTDEDQHAYFENVVKKLFEQENPQQILFSYLKDNKLIGYGGIVHINWYDKRGEVSFLLESKRNENIQLFKNEFEIYLKLIKVVAFEELALNKIYTEAYDIRPFLIESLENSGFSFEGRLRNHIWIDNKYVDSIIHAYFKDDRQDTENDSFNVLVTSISRKVPLLRAVKKSLNKISANGLVYGADTETSCVGQFFVDQFWLMPKTNDDHLEDILNYCVENKIKVIIPTRDGELKFWSKYKEKFKQQHIHILISNLEAIENTIDKLRFYTCLFKNNFPVIHTDENIENITSDFFVVKERFGSGSDKVGLRLTKKDAINYAQKLTSPIFQPYIEGKEYSIDVFLDQQSIVKGSIIRQRNKVINGESQITTVVDISALEDVIKNIAEFLELQGHVIFQAFIDKADRIHIIECNARFGGASSLSIVAGLDSFYWFFLEVAGKNLGDYPFIKTNRSLKQIRFPEDRIIDDSRI